MLLRFQAMRQQIASEAEDGLGGSRTQLRRNQETTTAMDSEGIPKWCRSKSQAGEGLARASRVSERLGT